MTGSVRVLQVSDSHLSTRAPFADDNWLTVVEHVRQTQPDLVVHTGDVTLDGASSDADLAHARGLLDLLPVPWLTVPGNHDVGDFVIEGAPDVHDLVTTARCDRYSDALGDRAWSRSIGEWQLVGVDVQALLDRLPTTEALWQWLTEQLVASAPTALFMHRPLLPHPTDHDEPNRYVTEPGRERLTRLLAAAGVRLVATGHIHQWHVADIGSARHVWAPSTWAVLPDRIQPTLGRKVVGVVEHTLFADGQSTSVLVQPAGIRQLVSGDDFDSPYSH